MLSVRHYIYDILVEQGVPDITAQYLNMLGLLIGLLIVAFIIDYITKRILWKFSATVASKTKTNFDNIFRKILRAKGPGRKKTSCANFGSRASFFSIRFCFWLTSKESTRIVNRQILKSNPQVVS